MGKERLLDFLTSNPEESEIVWSRDEIERRQRQTGFSYGDFIVLLNDQQEIKACTLLLSDSNYRKMKVGNMPFSLKVTQLFTPWLGRPKITEEESLRIGYLSFLKMRSTDRGERAHILDSFLQKVFFLQNQKPVSERYHLINLQEPKGLSLSSELTRRGYLSHSFSSTVYQVTTQQEDFPLLPRQDQRLDFDVVFH